MMGEAPRLDVETGWKPIEILAGRDAAFRAVVEQSEKNGLFRYSVEQFLGPSEEDAGEWPEGFWQAQSHSGLYNSVVEVLRDAQASIDRTKLLRDLVGGLRSVTEISTEIATFGWDSEEEFVSVERADVTRILDDYTAGRRSASDVRAWAEAIEGRDDIGFVGADEVLLRDAIFELANPKLSYALTPLLAKHLLQKLRE
jgi:hypothetical protein